MKLAAIAIAVLALLEVNVFFWRQHGRNLRQAAINAEHNVWHMKLNATQEELVRNLQGMQLRLEKLEPAGDPMLTGPADSLGRDKSE